MARIHTMEDDITFERVRHMPRRTRVCSMHRQLSWACQKEIQLYEKDSRVTTNSLERSKTAMQGRFRELVKVKKDLSKNKADLIKRRASCPAVLGENIGRTRLFQKDDAMKVKGHGVTLNATANSNDEVIENSIEMKGNYLKHFPRSISMYGKSVNANRGNRELETIMKPSKKDDVSYERRQTMPAL